MSEFFRPENGRIACEWRAERQICASQAASRHLRSTDTERRVGARAQEQD
jgi:hypothetical protein